MSLITQASRQSRNTALSTLRLIKWVKKNYNIFTAFIILLTKLTHFQRLTIYLIVSNTAY